MGYIKNLLITVYGGGQEAIDAVVPLLKAAAIGEWIPLVERLPPYGASVHTWDGKSIMVTTWWQTDRPFDSQGITHWMPLPEPPEVT